MTAIESGDLSWSGEGERSSRGAFAVFDMDAVSDVLVKLTEQALAECVVRGH